MLSKEQFDNLLGFTQDLLTKDEQAKELIEKASLTESQLKVIGIMIAYSIRAYDALKDGAEFKFS